MRRSLFAALLVPAMLLVVAGCTPAVPSPTATTLPSLTPRPSASPTPLPTAAFTNTPLPTQTSTTMPTATELPTATLTPSLTPTNTPQYNQVGVYPIERCVQYGFSYGDPAPGGTGVVSMCIIKVQINKDRSMQFNMLWHLVSATGGTPNRYVYGNIDAVYLTDEFGNRYDPLANSGRAPDRDENNDGVNSTSGWYLFPAPDKEARLFVFHDDDGKRVSIRDLSFKTP